MKWVDDVGLEGRHKSDSRRKRDLLWCEKARFGNEGWAGPDGKRKCDRYDPNEDSASAIAVMKEEDANITAGLTHDATWLHVDSKGHNSR